VQEVGAISDNGVMFYVKKSSQNILRRYDFEKLYDASYAEETSVLSSTTEIQGYQIDEESSKLVAKAWSMGAELVVNGTFDVDTSGWTAEANVTLSVVSQTLNVAINTSHVSPNGYYQDVPTEVGRRYRINISFVDTSAAGYISYWRVDVGGITLITPDLDPGALCGVPQKEYIALFTATSITTRVRICITYGSATASWNFDNISVKEVAGKIVKFNRDNTNIYTEYTILHPNFLSLSVDSLLLAINPERIYNWRAFGGKMVWAGSLSASKRLHYWDGTNTVEIYDVTTTGSLIDICVTDDFKKICYGVQSGSNCTWIVRSLENGTRWNELYSITRSVSSYGYGVFVDENWMYQLSGLDNWGYRLNLITYTTESWPTYTTTYSTRLRTIPLPNRSIFPGVLMYNIWFYVNSGSYPTNSILIVDLAPVIYGWDGVHWVNNHAGSKVTHHGKEPLPLYGSVGFGDDYWEKDGEIEMVGDTPGDHDGWVYHSGISENYVVGEYFNFAVNPGGYVFDNSMTHTSSPWVYVGIPQYQEEDHTLEWEDPLNPSNIVITLGKVGHPDFLCVEPSEDCIQVLFDDYVGKKASSIIYLSYVGEYYITSTGHITFHKSCNGLTVKVKYYWIRREL
jgi:hypothetical protein